MRIEREPKVFFMFEYLNYYNTWAPKQTNKQQLQREKEMYKFVNNFHLVRGKVKLKKKKEDKTKYLFAIQKE